MADARTRDEKRAKCSRIYLNRFRGSKFSVLGTTAINRKARKFTPAFCHSISRGQRNAREERKAIARNCCSYHNPFFPRNHRLFGPSSIGGYTSAIADPLDVSNVLEKCLPAWPPSRPYSTTAAAKMDPLYGRPATGKWQSVFHVPCSTCSHPTLFVSFRRSLRSGRREPFRGSRGANGTFLVIPRLLRSSSSFRPSH